MKRSIPIVQRVYMADGSYFQQILGSTKPGQKKMQFPYEIPPIEIELAKETNATIITAAGILAGGFVVGQLVRTFFKP